MVFHIYDYLFKSIFDTYPQGILDIINDIITEDFPQLIINWYPNAFWEPFPPELLNACPYALLDSESFRFHYKRKVNNEFFSKNGKKFIADRPFDTFEEIIIGLEFQSSDFDFKKESIFNVYQAGLHNEHQKRVLMVVISTVQDKHELIKHPTGLSDELTILVISLKALNQKQTLNSSLYKINNKYDMSDKEKALFFSSPLMDVENIVGAINVLMDNYYRISNLTDDERIQMRNLIAIYAERWCFKQVKNKNGGYEMVKLTPEAQKFVDSFIDTGIEKGIGITAVNMIKEGFTLDDTSRATGLSKTQINKLCESK